MCDDISIFLRYICKKCLDFFVDRDDNRDDNYISLDREVIEDYDKHKDIKDIKDINIELSPYCNDRYNTRNIVIIIDKEDKDKNLTFLKHRNSPKYYIKEGEEDDDFVIINYN